MVLWVRRDGTRSGDITIEIRLFYPPDTFNVVQKLVSVKVAKTHFHTPPIYVHVTAVKVKNIFIFTQHVTNIVSTGNNDKKIMLKLWE